MKMMQTVNNTPTMKSRCQHTDQKGQVSMTEINRMKVKEADVEKEIMTQAEDYTKLVNRKMTKFINRIGGRSIMPDEDKTRQRLLQHSAIAMEIKPQQDLKRRMKRVCDKLLNNFGKMSYDEEENICRVGKELLDRATKSNERRVSKSLMSWIDKTDELTGRCI